MWGRCVKTTWTVRCCCSSRRRCSSRTSKSNPLSAAFHFTLISLHTYVTHVSRLSLSAADAADVQAWPSRAPPRRDRPPPPHHLPRCPGCSTAPPRSVPAATTGLRPAAGALHQQAPAAGLFLACLFAAHACALKLANESGWRSKRRRRDMGVV